MQVTETLNEGLKRGYSITVPASELATKVEEKLEDARRDFQMKGFRKGKAPAALMKKMFGKSVLGEAMQETIDSAMRSHFETTGDRPALQPEVKMTNEDWKEGDDVEVSVTYETLPAVPELALGDIAIERLVVGVEPEAIDEALQNLASAAKDYDSRDAGAKAEDGDQIVIDFEGSIDGVPFEGGKAEDFPLVLGSGSFIPGFEPQLVGSAAGDAVTVNVTFPEAYGAPHLAGKDAVFAVTVKDVKAPKAAEVNDALAERYGLENLESLKEQIGKRLSDEYGQASRAIVKRNLMDALDTAAVFDVPATLVDIEAKQIAHQLWHEEHHDHHGHDHGEIAPTDEHLKLAERRVRLGLLLAEIGSKNDVTVADQDLQRALFAQARQYPGQERQFLEFVQKNPQAIQQIRAPLYEEKVVDFILERANVTERAVTKAELEAAVEALDATDAAPVISENA